MLGTLLGEGYRRNQQILERQVEGLSHRDALAQTPYNVNCMNWVLGHIANGRDDLLELLGGERTMSPASGGRYRRESEPIVEDGPDVLDLGELLALLRRSQEELSSRLQGSTAEELSVEREVFGATSTIAAWAQFFYFHDTYHTGQTELLRQMSGKSDTVI
jgi:uncharacterized damage-inducible protein DinB